MRALVVVALAAFAVLRLAALTRYPLWGDETWTLDVGANGFNLAMRRYADDQTHPPLFYAALWVWARIGPGTLAWWRTLPCLAGIATAVPVVSLARAAGFSRRATWLAVLLCAGSGILVAYSAELRDYALLALFGTASLAAWLRARDASGRTGLRALTIVNGLLAWSHYFGLFVIAAEWCDAAFWARRRLKALTVSAAISVATLLPWVAETIERALLTGHRLDVLSWLEKPAPGDLLDVPRAALGATPWLAADLALVVVAAAGVALWAWRRRRSAQATGIRVLALAVAVPVGVSYVASVAGPHPMWLDRYLIAAVPPLLLLVAGALDGLASAARGATIAVTAIALVPGALTARALVAGRERPRYDLVVREMATQDGGATTTLFAGGPREVGPLRYAVRAAGLASRTTVTLATPDSVAADSGWYVWSEDHPPAGPPPPAVLMRRGYRVGPSAGFGAARDSLAMFRFVRR
ncbi:MAG TPA: glycosyltransferase family 39 protein [Gemmatimonadaceae bacterium]|nr:glycosyltransferase family 39 protein [Gemmatimonadaceae bacterium]